ncbi:MAG: DUF2256 domain-containing protein [Rubripirellula sp.]
MSLITTDFDVLVACSEPCVCSEARRKSYLVGKKKNALPSKKCRVCGRPFSWRRKWQRCWDEVKYCSERCRRQESASSKATA